MDRRIILLILLGLAALVSMMPGCREPGSVAEDTADSSGIVVTDFRGREIRFEKPVERVVCLIESAFSGICMLEAQDRVVGVPGDVYNESLWKYYSQLDERIRNRTMPAPGNWEFISLEQVAGLEPELVIAWASQSDAIDNLEKLGIPVYAVMLHRFEDVYKEIADLGTMVGKKERADTLIKHTRERLEHNLQYYLSDSPPTAYFMWAQGINETSGKNSTVEELLRYAGTVNACGLEEEHVTVSLEKIVDWDPDMIVMWHNEKLDPSDILGNPVLKGIKAVRTNRVFELPGVFECDFWTLKMQFSVRMISQWAYPEKDDGLNDRQYLEDMFHFLYGMEMVTDE
jgi:iron complex transport system substrate-binding protein